MVTNEAGWYGNRALRWESEDLASIAGSDLHDPSDSRQISSLSHSLVNGKMRGLAWRIPKNPFPLKQFPFLGLTQLSSEPLCPLWTFQNN